MDLKQIKELMASMEKAKIKRIKIRTEKGFEVVLEKDGYDHSHPGRHHHFHQGEEHPHQGSHAFPHHALPPSRHAAEEHDFTEKEHKKEGEGTFVKSPMVGTLYSSPSPEDPHFVKVGDKVTEDTVVCIIEAMKVMNEVKAGTKGKIAEILVDNGHPVEFGTKIFRIV